MIAFSPPVENNWSVQLPPSPPYEVWFQLSRFFSIMRRFEQKNRTLETASSQIIDEFCKPVLNKEYGMLLTGIAL